MIQLLIERFFSPNPKLFKIISILSAILWCIAQGTLWVDNRIDLSAINDGWRALLDDVCVSTVSIIMASQFTTKNKSLQSETEKILNK